MKRLSLFFAFLAALAVPASAQNWATVTASNITDLNQQKLAAGQLCFLGTDQSDTPISFSVGGGGQVLKRSFCANVTNGAVSALTIPNPALTAPSGVYYRVTVIDSSSGREVLRYTQVTFSGGTFNFDSYAPVNLGQMSPLSGTSVTGTLSVAGNVNATGSVTAGAVVINGDTAMSSAPRAIYASFCPGTLTAVWTCSTLTVDKPITITRVQVQVKSVAVSCSGAAVIRVGDNATNNQDLTLSSSVITDTGPIVRNFAANTSMLVRVITPASTCTAPPSDANVTIQYKMQ